MILNTDCMPLMRSMPKNYVDLLLTDIPYDGVNRPSQGLRNLDKGDADILTFDLDEFLREAIRITKGSLYIWCGWGQISTIADTFEAGGLSTRLGVWEKTNPSPMNAQYTYLSGMEFCVFGKQPGGTFNAFYKQAKWIYPVVRGKRHPTEKPLGMFEEIIQDSSNPGDLVFDPCVGSGTTAEAANNLNRRFIVSDLNFEYCKKTQERLK